MTVQTAVQHRHNARVLYSAATFRQLLDSLARPGKIVQLTQPAFLGEPPVEQGSAVNLPALGALLTLLDSEVSFVVGMDNAWLEEKSSVAQWLSLRSGGRYATPENATFAFICSGSASTLLPSLNMGTTQVPEDSTTLIWCVGRLAPYPGDATVGAMQVELRGPGVPGVTQVVVAGLSDADLAAIEETRQSYPLGIDLYLIDHSGQCLGLPRTTRITRW